MEEKLPQGKRIPNQKTPWELGITPDQARGGLPGIKHKKQQHNGVCAPARIQ